MRQDMMEVALVQTETREMCKTPVRSNTPPEYQRSDFHRPDALPAQQYQSTEGITFNKW